MDSLDWLFSENMETQPEAPKYTVAAKIYFQIIVCFFVRLFVNNVDIVFVHRISVGEKPLGDIRLHTYYKIYKLHIS